VGCTQLPIKSRHIFVIGKLTPRSRQLGAQGWNKGKIHYRKIKNLFHFLFSPHLKIKSLKIIS